MSDLNKKNINYGALNRFYQDLKNHDLSDLNDKIDNIDLSDVYNLIYTLHTDEDYLNFSANLPNTKVRLVIVREIEEAEPSTPIDIDYSFDRINWTHYIVGDNITIPTGCKLYLRGNNDYFSVFDDDEGDILYYHYFEFENESENTLNVEAHGNINSLLSKTNWNEITTLADYCYYHMFYHCTSLTTAPELPATTLAPYCYSRMFNGCSSLTSAPELPATTLTEGCYQNMFSSCSSLTKAPELPATTLSTNCYDSMFHNCASLNYIKCLATNISASYCTNSWVNGVASTGTFVKAINMTGWITGNNGIPTNWTVENYTEPIIIDESTFTGATLTVDSSQPSIVASGTTTIVWDDLASSIPSGKSVEVSVVLINTGNSALTPTIQGNYQMMGDGNLTIQAGELGLYRGRYISALNKWLIEAIYQEVSGTAE